MATALSHSKCAGLVQRSTRGSQRLMVRPVPLSSSSTSRTHSVKVCAGKGKGGARRMMQAPQTQQMPKPQVPEVDPENEEICVFTRSTSGTYQNWIFVSVVKGGSQLNTLVKGISTPWGKTLYSRTIISNIGQTLYKDRDTIVTSLKKQIRSSVQYAPGAKIMEPLLNQPVSSFQFAFKIRDKTKPGEFQKAENLTIIPSEAEVSQLPPERFTRFFSPENLSSMFQGSSSS